MKYSIEYKDGKFIEELEVAGNTVMQTWQRDNEKGLWSADLDFSEQLAECLDEEVVDEIAEVFDGNSMVADIENFMIDTGVE